MAKFEIKSRFTGEVRFSVEMDAEFNDKSYALQLGFAVKKAAAARADLSGADLSSADLSRADLYGADLSGANLSGADLYGADLSRANLSRANLYGADLSSANLSGADLSRADLSRANLSSADLSGADLSGADLSSADLSGADLSRANLYGADLSRANLYGADLSSAKNVDLAIAKTRILPEGELIGWKKLQGGIIAKLKIPMAAKRCHAFGRKCRAEYAKVLALYDGKNEVKTANSIHDAKFVYTAGKIIRPDKFDENWQDECSHGIHFYISRVEAEAHT